MAQSDTPNRMRRLRSKDTSIEANQLSVSRPTPRIGHADACMFMRRHAARGLVLRRCLEYPPAVRRLLYTCLAVAIAGSSITPRSLHVHVSAGHSHQEHDHGPASHEHERRAPNPEVPQPQLSSCDPATHTVFLSHPFKVFSASATYTIAALATERFTVGSPLIERYHASPRVEPRQHGPPGDTPLSPRPPPITHPA